MSLPGDICSPMSEARLEIDFWQTRWQRGEIGFHLPRPHPKLVSLWPSLCPEPEATVFVPLCGKSLDLHWLAARGHRVIGVEASELAVQAFFAEQQLMPSLTRVESFRCYQYQRLQIYCGDFFALPAAVLAGCQYIYDRAALIALPEPLRLRYASYLQQLLPVANTLLLTLLYPQAQMSGPPFSVSEQDIQQLFPAASQRLLLDHDILPHEPRFAAKGVTHLHEQAWQLQWQV